MAETLSDEKWAEIEEFDQHCLQFYAAIGNCLTLFQSIDEYLPTVFASALGGSEARAASLFAIARAFDVKLKLIDAAMIGCDAAPAAYWPALESRLRQAFAARNQIAHAAATQHHEAQTITVNEANEMVELDARPKPRMELRKRTRQGETVWTLVELHKEHRRAETLFRNLIAFAGLLQGATPPPHLLTGLKT